jgi:hypothetical protein
MKLPEYAYTTRWTFKSPIRAELIQDYLNTHTIESTPIKELPFGWVFFTRPIPETPDHKRISELFEAVLYLEKYLTKEN